MGRRWSPSLQTPNPRGVETEDVRDDSQRLAVESTPIFINSSEWDFCAAVNFPADTGTHSPGYCSRALH